MKAIRVTLIIIISAGFYNSYSQNIFPKKFNNCNTDRFALENDSTTAKIEDEQLLKVLKQSFDERTIKKIRGTLSLQIIVDLDGSSCLISLKNDTNIKTKKLNLKENIDGDLKWNNAGKKVAAIIVFRFEKNGVKFIRLGMNAEKGVHELRPD